MSEIKQRAASAAAAHFASEVSVDADDRIMVDGNEVILWGVNLRKESWAPDLRLLLRWRRVYVIPKVHRGSSTPAVTLFTGRGDLASYLIWNGSATAASLAYSHVQLAAFFRKAWGYRRREF